jgi:hypothetical protein
VYFKKTQLLQNHPPIEKEIEEGDDFSLQHTLKRNWNYNIITL